MTGDIFEEAGVYLERSYQIKIPILECKVSGKMRTFVY